MKRITKSLFVLMLSCAMSFSIVANSLPIMADEVEETTQENDTNTAFKAAQQQMYKEYDDRSTIEMPDEQYGAFKGINYCVYAADGQDNCIWSIYTI